VAVAAVKAGLVETAAFTARRTAITIARGAALLPRLVVAAILAPAEIPARTTIRCAAPIIAARTWPVIAIEARAFVSLRPVVPVETCRAC
ncbi:hypothetical protein ABTM82_19175, partial [Acinetobacter baumannii]